MARSGWWPFAAVGIVVGVGSSLITSYLQRNDPVGPVPATSAVDNTDAPLERAFPSSPEHDDGSARLKQLERRIAELELPDHDDEGASWPGSVPDRTAIEHESRAYAARIADHQGEARDPNWSTSATAILGHDLDDMAAHGGFVVADVDCRTTTCSASLEWNTYDEAALAQGSLLHAMYRLNCDRTVPMVPPEGADPDAAYRITVLFDCTRFRTDPNLSRR